MSNEELVAVIQAGCVELMGELWDQIEKLVMWKAHRITAVLNGCGGVEFDDLYQSGYPALVAAVDSYKPEQGLFSSWFMLHLKTAFAEATGYRSKKQQQDPLHRAMSLDTPLTDEADSDDLMAIIADPAGMSGLEDAEEAIYRQQLHDALEAALDTIPADCSEVLRQRYYADRTLADLAEVHGVTPERVRKKECEALRYLRRPKTACYLRPFVDFNFYCGTGLGAFQHTGMSIQERYLVIEEERREKAEQQRQDRERHRREKKNRIAFEESVERTRQQAEELVSRMTPEEKARLLAEYGYT